MDNGFRMAKRKVIAALRSGDYLHATRGDIDVKNLLAMGEVPVESIVAVIRSCNGTHHCCSPHHAAPAIDVHVLRRHGWYIKFYFIEPDTWFISVHR